VSGVQSEGKNTNWFHLTITILVKATAYTHLY